MTYDFDLFVIGAGSGGVRASRFAASFGAKVAVAESRYLGGTCVNVGCVPKKLLSYAASFHDEPSIAQSFGWELTAKSFDWTKLINNKNTEIQRLNGIYKNLLVNSGVTLLEGHARFVDAQHVEVNGTVYSAKHILITVGGWPFVPDIPGKEHAISSNEVFYLPEQPKHIVIVGGGYIALEFASIFKGLGSEVEVIYRGDLFLKGFDNDVREHLKQSFEAQGIQLRFNSTIKAIEKRANNQFVAQLDDGQSITTNSVFYATGRKPMLDNLNIEAAGVALDKRGYIQVNPHYQTSQPNVYAMGDVIGRVQLTPVALAEGMAVARHLFKPEQYQPVDYQLIPTAVFTLPNISTVGLTEEQARAQGFDVAIFESRFRPMKLSLSALQERIYMKLIVDKASDKVLGCHMVGPEAAEIIQGLAIALKAGATKAIFDQTVGIHPSSAEEFVTMRTERT
ncbi:glutathione-disulfide reductase [Pseudomonas sp. F1_0610]|uniref:glutathione-disulfide reductase n=1 Tax=Pseudomonas sp. F1_0610 TaxID=3114284 RepID=UPI0039C3B739